MTALVTFPRLTLQAALSAHLASLGTLDTETLRYPHAPSVDTVEPLCEAVRAAEEERCGANARLATVVPALADALASLEWSGRRSMPGVGYVDACPTCRGFRAVVGGHAPDCALHAALVAAGRRG